MNTISKTDLDIILRKLFEIETDFNLAGISDRFEKDARRFRAFLEAVQKRTGQFLETSIRLVMAGEIPGAEAELVQARIFGNQARELAISYFAKLSDLSKFQFPKDLWSGKYKDPFAPQRASLRGFASAWQLDPKFVEMLG